MLEELVIHLKICMYFLSRFSVAPWWFPPAEGIVPPMCDQYEACPWWLEMHRQMVHWWTNWQHRKWLECPGVEDLRILAIL
jgi:hypothetical protein